MKKIAIFTIKEDLHSLVIQKELRNRNISCQLVEVDHLWENSMFNLDFQKNNFEFLDNEQKVVDVQSLNVIWWRRSVRGQKNLPYEIPTEQRGFINNEFEAVLFGFLHSKFKGKWISNQFSTTLASNKIYQTEIALKNKFNVPKTIFSQNKFEISKFIKENEFDVILKPIYGSAKVTVFTQKIDKNNLPNEEDLDVCPAIFQEFINGNIHYRVNVFGSKIYAFKIETEDLDWRLDYTYPTSYIELEDDFKIQIFGLLKDLNLSMGILDFKVNKKDNLPYFFEINPQGNFLFLEGLTKFNLKEKFADFLLEE